MLRVIRRRPYKARRSGPKEGSMILHVPQAFIESQGVEFGDDVYAFEDEEGRLVYEFKKPEVD